MLPDTKQFRAIARKVWKEDKQHGNAALTIFTNRVPALESKNYRRISLWICDSDRLRHLINEEAIRQGFDAPCIGYHIDVPMAPK